MLKTKKSASVDMTQGNIALLLIGFAVPTFLANVFQLLYNTVDTWVVGNFASNEAYSAVGSVGTIVGVFIGLFYGFSSGVTVLVAQSFGAKLYDRLSKVLHTAILSSVLVGLAVTVLGLVFSPAILKISNIPDEVMPHAVIYLRMYFIGVVGLAVYNICAGIMRAVGDSKTPLVLLILCSLINLVLDLVFVICFNMEAGGVALATAIAQAISASTAFIILGRRRDAIRIFPGKVRSDRGIFGSIARIGVPYSIQYSVGAVSNTIVHAYINAFGTDVMSGLTTYGRIEGLILPVSGALGAGVSTFFGQNLGKGDVERAKRGVKICVALSGSVAFVIVALCVIFAPQFSSFFNATPSVVGYSAGFLRMLAPLLMFAIVGSPFGSALISSGRSSLAMRCIFLEVAVRQTYLFVMSRYISNTPYAMVFSIGFGWIVTAFTYYFCYKRTDFNKRVVKL